MLSFLRLIRIQNLAIIAVTMYLMRFLVIKPMLENFPIVVKYFVKYAVLELQFSELNFALLVLATISIAAGGYIINDYLDVKADMINRPEKIIIGKKIASKLAFVIYTIFNIIGIGLGFYLGYQIELPKIGFLFVIIVGVLWYYSATYKKQFLLGNIIVALLTALVPMLVAVFEIPLLKNKYQELISNYQADFISIIYWIAGFSLFAFLLNLIREIVKDIEDLEGDNAYGLNTMPIIAGVKASKITAVALTLTTVVIIFIFYFKYLESALSLIYISLLIALPLLFVGYKIIIAESAKEYHTAGTILKITMFTGICYAFVINYVINSSTF